MDATTASLSLHQLRELYLRHAQTHYRRRSGDPTREHLNMKAALDRFVAFAGEAMIGARINRHLVRAWVDQLAAEGLSRAYVNQCLSRVRRWVRWSADFDHVPFSVTEDLRLVRPLAPFRSKAKEPAHGAAPSLDDVIHVCGSLPPIARDVLQLIKLTGARPSELLELTNGEVFNDDHGPRIVPRQHKSAHHGHQRVIPLTTGAFAILATRWRPMLPSDRVFECHRTRRGHYSIDAFRAAIKRACKHAGIVPFTPYQVRRAVARHVRQHRGLDAAQALLGHSSSRTTELYAPLTAGDARTLDAARRATEVL